MGSFGGIMKASYLSKQDRIDKHGYDLQPLFLVNVIRDGHVNTEVFRASEHELSKEDMARMQSDLDEWNQERRDSKLNNINMVEYAEQVCFPKRA